MARGGGGGEAALKRASGKARKFANISTFKVYSDTRFRFALIIRVKNRVKLETSNFGRILLSKVLPGAFPPKHFQTSPLRKNLLLLLHATRSSASPPQKKEGGVWLLVPKRGKNSEWGGGHTYWGLGRQVAGKKTGFRNCWGGGNRQLFSNVGLLRSKNVLFFSVSLGDKEK